MSSIDSYIDEVVLTDEDGMPTGSDLPVLAETYSASRPSSIDAPGLIAGIQLNTSISEPYIDAGIINMPASGGVADVPLAQYCNPYVAETAGLIAGARVSTVSEPIILDGVLMLPPAQEADVPLAQYNPAAPSSAVSGVIAGIKTSSVSTAAISDGVIILPESSGGDLNGLYVNGNALPWSSISGTRLTGFTISTAGTTYAFDLFATYSNGYLSLYFA